MLGPCYCCSALLSLELTISVVKCSSQVKPVSSLADLSVDTANKIRIREFGILRYLNNKNRNKAVGNLGEKNPAR